MSKDRVKLSSDAINSIARDAAQRAEHGVLDSMRQWWGREVEMLTEQIDAMKDYLALVTARGDYHGVMDAGADIRELTARRSVFVDLLATVADGGAAHRLEEIKRTLLDIRLRRERRRS